MTWEETIRFIRHKPEYAQLVEQAYLEEDLKLNVERFKDSEEFRETMKLLNRYVPEAVNILDVGAGNGISSIAFAQLGYQVTVAEPDPSDTVGAGAIRSLQEKYSLDNLTVFEEYAEKINFQGKLFDVIYARQSMHHAYDLKQFVKNLSLLLKKGGLFITVRDHVVFSESDKDRFLQVHPLQKFYGGENAFSPKEYREAMENAGLIIQSELRYFDSVINYFPLTDSELVDMEKKYTKTSWRLLKRLPFFNSIFTSAKMDWKLNAEAHIPGRMYSYICTKS